MLRKRRFRSKPEKMAALMLDLNGFKAINDTYSHEEGDCALVNFANILVNSTRGEGRVIRYAGDEFVIIFRKFKGESVEPYKEKILKAIEEYNKNSGKPYQISCAVGGQVFDYNGQEISEVISAIDNLMYSDKKEYYTKHNRRQNR